MSHPRRRHISPLLIKKLKFARVVALQGARQVGKSYLVRDILPKFLSEMHYQSFDQPSVQTNAAERPETFLENFADARPLAIDEAQKVPALFDAIKYRVDNHPEPGQYLLLGSTEFSRLSLIRESLTGRLSRIRLFPMTASESLHLELQPASHTGIHLYEKPRTSRQELLRYLGRGGFPGIFAVRSESERRSLLEDWVSLTVERDIHQFKKVKLEADLARQILEQIVQLDEPDAGRIASKLRRDVRRVKTHLEALRQLFVIHLLPPHRSSTGKTLYFVADVGLAQILNASFERQLQTWVLLELLAYAQAHGENPRLSFYRTPKGRFIDFVIETDKSTTALKIYSTEGIMNRDLELLRQFRTKLGDSKLKLIGLAGTREENKSDRISIYPWESFI